MLQIPLLTIIGAIFIALFLQRFLSDSSLVASLFPAEEKSSGLVSKSRVHFAGKYLHHKKKSSPFYFIVQISIAKKTSWNHTPINHYFPRVVFTEVNSFSLLYFFAWKCVVFFPPNKRISLFDCDTWSVTMHIYYIYKYIRGHCSILVIVGKSIHIIQIVFLKIFTCWKPCTHIIVWIELNI